MSKSGVTPLTYLGWKHTGFELQKTPRHKEEIVVTILAEPSLGKRRDKCEECEKKVSQLFIATFGQETDDRHRVVLPVLQVAPTFRLPVASRPDTLYPVSGIVGPDPVNDP